MNIIGALWNFSEDRATNLLHFDNVEMKIKEIQPTEAEFDTRYDNYGVELDNLDSYDNKKYQIYAFCKEQKDRMLFKICRMERPLMQFGESPQVDLPEAAIPAGMSHDFIFDLIDEAIASNCVLDLRNYQGIYIIQ